MTPDELRCRIETALAMGGDVMTFGDLIEQVGIGRCQLWMDDDSAVATELIIYPRKRVLNMFMVAGSLKAVMKWQPKIEEFAHQHRVDMWIASGSPGWQRIGRRDGWRVNALTFVRHLRGN